MWNFLADLGIIMFLILINGFFAGAEIAVLTLGQGKLQAMKKVGSGSVERLAKLKENPDRMIATIQIGITLVATLASVYGGARMLMHIAPLLSQINIPIIDMYKDELAFTILVLGISYLTLLFGELIPKSLALSYASQFSRFVAYPLHLFSLLFKVFVNALLLSSRLILSLFNKHTTTFGETRLHEDEIRFLLQEGVQAGSIADSEHEIINNIFEINDKTVREIMTPRVNIEAIPLGANEEEIKEVVINGKRSWIPVYKQDLDKIEGLLDVKEFLRSRVEQKQHTPESLLQPVFHVPEGMKLDKALQEMQRRRNHMAIVIDEYGGTSGLITLEDILEEIVGDINDDDDKTEQVMVDRISDTVSIVNGACPIHEFNRHFKGSPIPESDAYHSVAGFVIEATGRFPEVSEKIVLNQLEFELLKRLRLRLREFRVKIITDLPQVVSSGNGQKQTGQRPPPESA